ncbi:UNVERIFIED_ORG: hypothetical protein M2348_001927 [Sphingomonas sp. R1F5B]
MRSIVLALPLVLLAACHKAPQQSDDAAIAQVEAAQKERAPAQEISPQVIDFFDITKGKLTGSGCNFVPDNGGMGAVLLAQEDRGLIKIKDQIVVLAADKGSAKLPQHGWSHYTGREWALTLTRIDDGKAKTMGVIDSFDGQLVISDADSRPVYTAKGNVQCKPM